MRDEIPFVLVPYKPFAGYEGLPYYFLLDNVRDIQPTSEISTTVYMIDGSKLHADGNIEQMHQAITQARQAALNPMIADVVPFRTAIEAYNSLRADMTDGNKQLWAAMAETQQQEATQESYFNTLIAWRAALCIRRLANDSFALRVIYEAIPDVQQVHPMLLGRQQEVAIKFIDEAIDIRKAMQDVWDLLTRLRDSGMSEKFRNSVCSTMMRNEHLVPESIRVVQ